MAQIDFNRVTRAGDEAERRWAVRHFGKKEQIGVCAYREILSLMKSIGARE